MQLGRRTSALRFISSYNKFISPFTLSATLEDATFVILTETIGTEIRRGYGIPIMDDERLNGPESVKSLA